MKKAVDFKQSKRSTVCELFPRGKNIAKCNRYLCLKELAYYGRTMNLQEHLCRVHLDLQPSMHRRCSCSWKIEEFVFDKSGHKAHRVFWYSTFATVLLEYSVFSDNEIDRLFVSSGLVVCGNEEQLHIPCFPLVWVL